MPIKVKIVPNGALPIAICDYCGERIEDARAATYEWDGGTYESDSLCEVFLLHGNCSPAHEKAHGSRLDSMPLIDLLPFLAYNLQVDLESAQRHADMISRLG